MYIEGVTNPRCPNRMAHLENAYDRLFPGRPYGPMTVIEMDAVDVEAADEYAQCEGHE